MLSECYRLLGLDAGASFEEVKTSYRRLVRRYHPDVNPSNTEWAKEKFIELTCAYQHLTQHLAGALTSSNPRGYPIRAPHSQSPTTQSASPFSESRPQRPVEIRANPNLSDVDNQLKKVSYQQLQDFLRNKRFARAIALVDGLAQRMPADAEVKQWQAIAYQQYARHFASEHQYVKAKIYLKKALRIDPTNRKLWLDIKRDFDQLQRTHLKQQI